MLMEIVFYTMLMETISCLTLFFSVLVTKELNLPWINSRLVWICCKMTKLCLCGKAIWTVCSVPQRTYCEQERLRDGGGCRVSYRSATGVLHTHFYFLLLDKIVFRKDLFVVSIALFLLINLLGLWQCRLHSIPQSTSKGHLNDRKSKLKQQSFLCIELISERWPRVTCREILLPVKWPINLINDRPGNFKDQAWI